MDKGRYSLSYLGDWPCLQHMLKELRENDVPLEADDLPPSPLPWWRLPPGYPWNMLLVRRVRAIVILALLYAGVIAGLYMWTRIQLWILPQLWAERLAPYGLAVIVLAVALAIVEFGVRVYRMRRHARERAAIAALRNDNPKYWLTMALVSWEQVCGDFLSDPYVTVLKGKQQGVARQFLSNELLRIGDSLNHLCALVQVADPGTPSWNECLNGIRTEVTRLEQLSRVADVLIGTHGVALRP